MFCRNVCKNEENKKIMDLESVGQLNGHWENLRKMKLDQHQAQLARYHARLEFLMSRYGRKLCDTNCSILVTFSCSELHS